MQVIRMLSERQRAVVEAAKKLGSLPHAAKLCRIPKAELEEWRKDPDIALSLDIAAAEGDGQLYQKALGVVEHNLGLNDMFAAKVVLQAVHPEKWNPAQRISVEAVIHRFIDFDGREIHGNLLENDTQKYVEGSVIAGHFVPDDASEEGPDSDND